MRLVLATGPLATALSTGASVLPVFTLRKAGRFEVTLGQPIALVETTDGEADYGTAVQTYADMVHALRSQRSGAIARIALCAPA
jgi:hypothetical protein